MSEELKKLADDYSCQYMTQDYIQVSYDSFLCGAEAAEDALIKKACEWLKNNCTYTHPRTGKETCVVNLNAFKKAMEEQL